MRGSLEIALKLRVIALGKGLQILPLSRFVSDPEDGFDALEYQRRAPETGVLYRGPACGNELGVGDGRSRSVTFGCRAEASVRHRIATAVRAGMPVMRLGDRIETEDVESRVGEQCASVQGFSLHAAGARLLRASVSKSADFESATRRQPGR